MNMIFGRHHHPNHSSSPSALIMFTQEPLTLESGESPWFPLLSSLRDIWPSSCVFVSIYKENKEFIRNDLFYFFLTNFAPKVENKLFKRGKDEKESEFFQSFCTNCNAGKGITIYNAFKLSNQSSLKYCFIYLL